MASLSNLVGLSDPVGELFIELIEGRYAELVDEQAFGIRRSSPDSWIFHLPLQVEVSIEPQILRFRSRKAAT